MAIFRPVGWPTWHRARFDELDRMRTEMERLFEGLTGRPFGEARAGVFPLANVTEDDHNFYVRAELPGMGPDEIDVSVTGDSLSISGERKIAAEKEEAKYHRREREAGQFNRVISLPGQIDTGKVEAGCVDGVLTITLPKAEAAKPKQVTVKTG